MFLFLAENLPFFVVLPVHPPADYYGTDDWVELTYSVQIQNLGKIFILRREGVFSNGEGESQSWQSIVSYFDEEFSKYNWRRDEDYAPCDIYLPEAEFIPFGENGYVHYRRLGYQTSQDNISSDLICLAVWVTEWNNDGTPRNFRITLLTARPSYLQRLSDLL
jgi:hypothetical protein